MKAKAQRKARASSVTPPASIAQNRKASYQYTILSTKEAGIVLFGSEVKSLRRSGANLTGGYARLTDKGEMEMLHVHIKAYQGGAAVPHDPKRARKLLLKKKELRKLVGELKVPGQTLIPLELYFKKQLIKVKLGLCTGKKEYDKRSVQKERDANRKIELYMKTRYLKK